MFVQAYFLPGAALRHRRRDDRARASGSPGRPGGTVLAFERSTTAWRLRREMGPTKSTIHYQMDEAGWTSAMGDEQSRGNMWVEAAARGA